MLVIRLPWLEHGTWAPGQPYSMDMLARESAYTVRRVAGLRYITDGPSR